MVFIVSYCRKQNILVKSYCMPNKFDPCTVNDTLLGTLTHFRDAMICETWEGEEPLSCVSTLQGCFSCLFSLQAENKNDIFLKLWHTWLTILVNDLFLLSNLWKFLVKVCNSPICIPLLLSTVAYSPWRCFTKLLQIFSQFFLFLWEGVKALHSLSLFWDDQFITV